MKGPFALSSPVLTYGITPPKVTTSPEKLREVAEKQVARISTLPVDALLVYDLQDESTRTDVVRPYPYVPCVPSADYALTHLSALRLPKIIYQCVGPLGARGLQANLARFAEAGAATVFVGAASRSDAPLLRLEEAYAVRAAAGFDVPLGGVVIAERHRKSASEHERALRKVRNGASFFVSQAVYSTLESKNLLSDLSYACLDRGLDVPPLLITLSPCGSLRTLEFLRWLGVDIPRYLENDLRRSRDILQTSLDVCTEILSELVSFARAKAIPLGCNVESVSLAKAEIEASVELVQRAHRLLRRDA